MTSRKTAGVHAMDLTRHVFVVLLVGVGALSQSGCVTVKPQQRSILADPSMRFDDDVHQQAQRDHAIENREGAYGGNGVAGGGCGCN
jgi:hypothetical protein